MFAVETMQEPAAWLPGLGKLLYAVKAQRARDVLSLCIHMTGDINAGLVLSRLLYWMPKGCREDGVIWKADREWQDELLLSYEQMNRVRELLNPFVDWWKEQAQGAPTYHYRLKVDALVKGVAGVISRTVAFVRGFLFEKVENRFPGKSKIDFRESQESITNKTPQTTQLKNIVADAPFPEKAEKILELPNDAAARLIEAGVSAKVAREFAGLPVTVVQGVIDDALLKQQAGKLRKTRQAYIVGALRAVVAAPVEAKGLPWLTHDMLVEQQAAEIEHLPLTPYPLSPPVDTGSGEPAAEDIAGDVAEESRDAQVFRVAMAQLEIQLDRGNFDTWLHGARLLRVERGADLPDVNWISDRFRPVADAEGLFTTFVIAARNSFAVDMLQNRLYRTIARIFWDVVGQPVALKFEVVG